MSQHQQDDGSHSGALDALLARRDGFSLAETADFGADQRAHDDRMHCGTPPDGRGKLARRRIESTDPEIRSRLRRVRATMISGPDVLRAPQRWPSFFLREDRQRFGDTGPARRRLRWWQALAIGACLAALYALAGDPR